MKTNPVQECFLFSVFLLFISCNSIPDAVNYKNVALDQSQVGKNYKVDSVTVFNLEKDYRVDFYGIRVCTTDVKGTVKLTSDSLYCRITCLGDTVLETPDSTYGLAEFRTTDVMNWDSLYSRIKVQKEIIGEILADFLDPGTVAIIDSAQKFSLLPSSVKKSVLNSLNAILSTFDFYHTYKEKIENDVFFMPVLEKMYADVRDLVELNIFTDTLGTVKKNLTPFEKEKVKWFNWRLLARYIDNDANAADFGKLFTKFSVAGRLFALLFEEGSSPDELSDDIIRFISERNTGLYQVAYSDESGLYISKDNKILDYIFMCDMDWGVPYFLWQPRVSFIDAEYMSALINPGRATVKYTGFSVAGDSTWNYDLQMYYPVIGAAKKGGEALRIMGTITSTFRFFKSSNYLLKKNQAYINGWDTFIHIRAFDSEGNSCDYKEYITLKSDDGTG